MAELSVEVFGADVATAYDGAGQALRRVREAVLAHGVAEQDLRTTQTSVWREERTRPDGSAATALIHATLGLAVRVRDLAAVGETVTAALVAAGDAGRIGGLTFEVADADAAWVQARKAAFADGPGPTDPG